MISTLTYFQNYLQKISQFTSTKYYKQIYVVFQIKLSMNIKRVEGKNILPSRTLLYMHIRPPSPAHAHTHTQTHITQHTHIHKHTKHVTLNSGTSAHRSVESNQIMIIFNCSHFCKCKFNFPLFIANLFSSSL